MANEGSTKPTSSELEAEIEGFRNDAARFLKYYCAEQERRKAAETSLARVRGLLQRLIEDNPHCHWCWECEAGADVDGGARLIHKTDCELGKFLGAESADIGKLDSADKKSDG